MSNDDKDDGDSSELPAHDDDIPFVTITDSDVAPENTVWVPVKPCTRCGWQPPFNIGSNEAGAQFAQYKFTCPVCGTKNKEDGTHEVVEDADTGKLRMAFHDLTMAELAALRAAVQAAQKDAETVEDVAAAIEDKSPGIAEWLRSQGNRMELYAVITFLLALIAWALQNPETPPTQQNININQFIGNVQSGQTADLPLGRRHPCFCNSGKRFKNCCGRYPGAGAAVNARPTWP